MTAIYLATSTCVSCVIPTLNIWIVLIAYIWTYYTGTMQERRKQTTPTWYHWGMARRLWGWYHPYNTAACPSTYHRAGLSHHVPPRWRDYHTAACPTTYHRGSTVSPSTTEVETSQQSTQQPAQLHIPGRGCLTMYHQGEETARLTSLNTF